MPKLSRQCQIFWMVRQLTNQAHFFCSGNDFHTLFCCKNDLRTLFCRKNDLCTLLCRENNLHTFFMLFTHTFLSPKKLLVILLQKRFTDLVQKVFAYLNLPSQKLRLFGPLQSIFNNTFSTKQKSSFDMLVDCMDNDMYALTCPAVKNT